MKKLILFSVLFVSCGYSKVAIPKADGTEMVEVRKLTDDQKISLLRFEAQKRGLQWKIWCTPQFEGDQDEFDGWAVRKGEPFEVYEENGGKSSWWVFMKHSQADAAFALYQRIQKDPDEPLHKDKPVSERKRKICPPELRGD